jgi:protein involved in polysaccharide export with SLBB domain
VTKYGEKPNYTRLSNGDKVIVYISGWYESFKYAPEFFVKTAF